MRPVLVRSVEQYVVDVQRRLRKIKKSRGALAREIPIAMTQLSRYLRMKTEPMLSMFVLIEATLQRMEDQARKKNTK